MTEMTSAPRDAAFWATCHQVQAEEAAAFARLECLREGHRIYFGTDQDGHCDRCGLSAEDALWDDGWAQVDDRWVQVGRIDMFDLDRNITRIIETTHPDGTQGTTARLRHRPTGVDVTVTHAGGLRECQQVAMRALAVAIARKRLEEREA